MIILDNPSTAFLYAMAFNIPTIVFWDKNLWLFRETVLPYFSDLEKVGIYYNTPEAAAEMFKKIYDNPILWWYSEDVQAVRRKFCDAFIKVNSSYYKDFRSIFRKLTTKEGQR